MNDFQQKLVVTMNDNFLGRQAPTSNRAQRRAVLYGLKYQWGILHTSPYNHDLSRELLYTPIPMSTERNICRKSVSPSRGSQ